MSKQGVRQGGRQKGTPNKTTAEMREMIAAFVREGMKGAPKALRKLEKDDPEAYLNCLSKFLPFIVPKQLDVGITDENGLLKTTIKLSDGTIIEV